MITEETSAKGEAFIVVACYVNERLFLLTFNIKYN